MPRTPKRALLDAATDGKLDIVKRCLEEGADPNVKDGDGYTPFLLAIGEGCNEVCEHLLRSGASALEVNRLGASAMHIAASAGNIAGLELAYREGVANERGDRYGQTPLMDAVNSGQEESIRWLLSHGANVNARDNDGWACLHNAYARRFEYQGPSPLIPILLENGADLSIEDKVGRKPEDLPSRPKEK